MPSIEMFIPIIPKAQKRDRIAVVDGHARSYKHKSQKVQEDNLRTLIYRELPTNHLWPIQTPIKLWIAVVMPIPSSVSKKKQNAMHVGDIRHTTKPDLSNMLKNIEDVGNGVIWKDDKLIDQIMIRKYYGHEPGWHIRLEW